MKSKIIFLNLLLIGLSLNVPAQTGEQGIYFVKKVYIPSPLPSYKQVKTELPQPVFDENPLWIETWWKAWELAFRNFYEPEPGSGFVSPLFDAAFNENIFLWDVSFITMFANYAHPVVRGIESLDNFYCKQHPSGEISREINRSTGKDCDLWINTENSSLYSCHGYHVPAKANPVKIQYIGCPTPSPNPLFTLEALNHPILAWAEWESYKITGNKKRLAMILEPLNRYYQALKKYIRQGNGLYMTDWASMDNSTRNAWLEGGGTGIDISSEMVLFARNLSDIAKITGKKDLSRQYAKEADDLSEIINQKMWDNNQQFYFDLNLENKKSDIKTIAGFWPLVARVSSPQQASGLFYWLNDTATFARTYPVPTLAANQPGYSPSGDYWCGGVWAPTNTMVIRGLEQYGYDSLAYTIAIKHLAQVAEVYRQTGTIWETYSADKPSYGLHADGKPVVKDFVGWSGIGPIMYLLEYAIGLKPDAIQNQLTWTIRSPKTVGCRQYRFNGHTVSLVAQTNQQNEIVISIDSDGSFKLRILINGQSFDRKIKKGHQDIKIPQGCLSGK